MSLKRNFHYESLDVGYKDLLERALGKMTKWKAMTMRFTVLVHSTPWSRGSRKLPPAIPGSPCLCKLNKNTNKIVDQHFKTSLASLSHHSPKTPFFSFFFSFKDHVFNSVFCIFHNNLNTWEKSVGLILNERWPKHRPYGLILVHIRPRKQLDH